MNVMSAGRSWRKIALALFAGLVLAACQTTGLKPGALKTGFPPDGWATAYDGNKTIYYCARPACREPQLVGLVPRRQKGDVEEAIRRNVLSSAVVDSLFNVLKVASRERITASKSRRITTPTYSGFELMLTVTDRKGETVHVAIRDIIQRNRGVAVMSMAKSSGLARRNLALFLAQTTIQRVQ